MESVGIHDRMKNAGKIYRLLVMVQVLAFLVVLGLRIRIGSYPYQGDPPADRRVYSDLRGGLKVILEMFEIDCGRYPTTEEGLKVLISRPDNIPPKDWRGPYFDPAEVPKDPWGRGYVYRFPGIHNPDGFDLYSCGRDGISKSGGNDLDDINNWDPSSPRDRDVWLAREQQFSSALKLLLIIPFLFVVRVVAGIFSKPLRDLAEANRSADWSWLALSIAILFINLVYMVI